MVRFSPIENDPHPLRCFRLNPHQNKILEQLRKQAKRPVASARVNDSPIAVYEQELRLPFADADIRSLGDLQSALGITQKTQERDWSFQKFWDQHRRIFEFDPFLSEALAATDIASVPWSEMRLPHPEFYIGFGDFLQPTFNTSPERKYVIDGAYVRQVPKSSFLPADSLLLTFTGRLVDPTYEEVMGVESGTALRFADPIYEYFVCGEGCETVGEAIAQGAEVGRREAEGRDRNLLEMAVALSDHYAVVPFPRVALNPFIQRYERGRAVVEPMLPLLFNAIFYLCQRPEAQSERIPETAPPEDAARLRSTTNPALRASILAKLLKRGIATTRFVRDPDLRDDREPSGLSSGKKVRAHWRRGHWRKQVHGPGHSLRRWLWILPVLVKGGGGAVELEIGTVQRVRGDD